MKSKPIAVLISDVHYSLANLKLADAAMRMAIAKANALKVPLIVAGDLHDTKANMRAECVNAMIATFRTAKTRAIIVPGNHDMVNERSAEHALNFLRGVALVHDKPGRVCTDDHGYLPYYLVPYQHDIEYLKSYLATLNSGTKLIMHQGVQGSDSGDYIQDKSAITKEDVAGLRVISGHYHTRQTIELPDGGKWDYIGNPYTQNYAEANDPEKGFQILMDDGSLEFVPTNLREHRIMEGTVKEMRETEWIFLGSSEDLVWAKLSGTKEELASVNKKDVAYNLDIEQPFKLTLIPTDSSINVPESARSLTQGALLDSLIDSQPDMPKDRLEALKQRWKTLCE